MRWRTRTLLAGLGLLLAALPAGAQKLSRPSGPITITAKNGEWQDGVMTYTGDVEMISSTLELRGARLELRQPGGSRSPYEIVLTGEPAALKHASESPQDLPVEAQATRIVYLSASQDVELVGNARLLRGKDEINGETVRYNVPTRRVQASGGDSGQVRIVIEVPEETGLGPPAASPEPAKATPPAPTP